MSTTNYKKTTTTNKTVRKPLDFGNKEAVVSVIKQLEAACSKIAEEHGLVFKRGGLRYRYGKIPLRTFELCLPDAGGEKSKNPFVNDRRQAFLANKLKHGFSKKLLDRIVYDSDRTAFKVVGYKPANRKYPMILERVHDKRLQKCPVAYLQRLLSLPANCEKDWDSLISELE